MNPNLSAWAQLHGPFNFNHTPITPPGICILIHEKPSVWGTWAPHAVDGWYLGPAMRSYRCYTVWCMDTHAQCICDTLTWLPANLPIPNASASDYIIAGLHDITQALRHLSKHSPLAPLTTNQVDALEQLMTILHGSNKPALEPMPKQFEKPLLPTPSLRVGPTQTEPQHVHPSSAPSLRVVTDQPRMILLTPDPSEVPDPMDISTDTTVGTDNWTAP